jgi:hypothetical protein
VTEPAPGSGEKPKVFFGPSWEFRDEDRAESQDPHFEIEIWTKRKVNQPDDRVYCVSLVRTTADVSSEDATVYTFESLQDAIDLFNGFADDAGMTGPDYDPDRPYLIDWATNNWQTPELFYANYGY